MRSAAITHHKLYAAAPSRPEPRVGYYAYPSYYAYAPGYGYYPYYAQYRYYYGPY